MKRISFIKAIVIIHCLWLQSCAQGKVVVEDIKIHDSILNDSPYFITNTLKDWQVQFVGRGYDEANTLTARVMQIDGDTTKNLVVFLDDKMESFGIVEYKKEFTFSSNRHHILFDQKDTLFHYYAPVGKEDISKTFTIGEYYFKSINRGLSLEERPFFKMHRDSLTRVRGNGLPKLPSN